MSNGTSYDKAIWNTKDNMLRDTNCYEVLENYDEVENAEIKTVKQPLCEPSNIDFVGMAAFYIKKRRLPIILSCRMTCSSPFLAV